MSEGDQWVESGRSVSESGQIVYVWPPEGRFAELWKRFEMAFPDESERSEVMALLHLWTDETSRLVAYTDESGEWVDVNWPWDHDQ